MIKRDTDAQADVVVAEGGNNADEIEVPSFQDDAPDYVVHGEVFGGYDSAYAGRYWTNARHRRPDSHRCHDSR